MGNDDELFNEREELLQKYESLMKEVNYKRFTFKLRRNFKDFGRHYERYKHIPLDEKPYLTAANRAFSRKLSEFEKLIGGKDDGGSI